MTVYFITELENSLRGQLIVKIGRSQALTRRMSNLQTGNVRDLALMGEIRTRNIEDDRSVEAALHTLFKNKRENREWFALSVEDVLAGLKRFSTIAYATVGPDPFEIVSYDRDAIPEFASPWAWADLESGDFCPACGWACGWTYSENHGAEICWECGASEHYYEDAHREEY